MSTTNWENKIQCDNKISVPINRLVFQNKVILQTILQTSSHLLKKNTLPSHIFVPVSCQDKYLQRHTPWSFYMLNGMR